MMLLYNCCLCSDWESDAWNLFHFPIISVECQKYKKPKGYSFPEANWIYWNQTLWLRARTQTWIVKYDHVDYWQHRKIWKFANSQWCRCGESLLPGWYSGAGERRKRVEETQLFEELHRITEIQICWNVTELQNDDNGPRWWQATINLVAVQTQCSSSEGQRWWDCLVI